MITNSSQKQPFYTVLRTNVSTDKLTNLNKNKSKSIVEMELDRHSTNGHRMRLFFVGRGRQKNT
jgi:hypothetical protein